MKKEERRPTAQPCGTCKEFKIDCDMIYLHAGYCEVGGNVKEHWTGCIAWKEKK